MFQSSNALAMFFRGAFQNAKTADKPRRFEGASKLYSVSVPVKNTHTIFDLLSYQKCSHYANTMAQM